MSPCPSPEQLQRLLAEELDDTERDPLECHIEGCAACQGALEELSRALVHEGERTQGGDRSRSRHEPGSAFLRWLKREVPDTAAGGEGQDSKDTASSLPESTAAESARSWPQLPGYEILGVLGKGGMGIVYKARHRALNRLVALKMIRAAGPAEAAALARFRTEAEAIARLQHPHVVQIYEVGEYDGLPYLALEFVEGGSLSQRLDGTPLPARQAAQLVEELARAVQAAHDRGLVHRDLKPTNVLLTAEGAPKVSDFGLAKLMDSGAGPTATGEVLGTPSYMAPEQAESKGWAVGPATDVYALGAILYELLTGRPPFRAATALETLMQVVHEEPVPPRRLQSGTPRDLETVCLKCLQKEPKKRYATAEALAEDLRRFGAGRPILARPVGPLGRLGRWARRQPVTAGLLGALLMALLLGLSGVTLLWRRAEAHLQEAQHQRERAEESFRDARGAVEQMLTEVGQERLKGIPELDPVRQALLEKAAAFYEKFLRERGDDPAVREEAALAYNRVGLINKELGRLTEAEAAYQQGLSLLASLAAQAPHEPRYRLVMARTHSAGLGALYGRNQRYGKAEESLRAALAILEPLTSEYPDSDEYRQDLANCYNNLGILYYETNRLDRAETAHGEALKIRARLAGAPSDTPLNRHRLAGSHNNLGMVFRESGRPKQAEGSFQTALDIWRRLITEDPNNLDYQDAKALCCQNLGWLYFDYLGRPTQAEAAYQEALQVREKLAREHSALVDNRSHLALVYGQLARVYGKLEQSAKTEAAYMKVLEIADSLARARPDVPRYRDDLADAYYHLGWYHQSAGRLEQAESYYAKALPLRKQLAEGARSVTKYQRMLSQLHHARGMLYHKGKRFPEAVQAYQEAIRIREKLAQQPPSNAPLLEDLAWSYHNLGNTFEAGGQPKKAEEVRAKALAIRERLARENPKMKDKK
jgi:tetratricopeptide (TPR) repeat protein